MSIRRASEADLVLSVDTPNGDARSFYDDLGFVDAARTLRAPVEQLL